MSQAPRIFPEITLTETEKAVVADKLTDPAVVKYFHKLAYDAATELCIYNEPPEGETTESFLRIRCKKQGQLEAMNALLSFEQNPNISK